MDDNVTADCSTGWNVGATGLTETCTREAWSPFGAAATCCYETCRQLGKCTDDGEGANCGWSTCFEDLDFFKKLLATVDFTSNLPLLVAYGSTLDRSLVTTGGGRAVH